MKAPVVLVFIIAAIIAITATASIANVQFELDQLLQQQQPTKRSLVDNFDSLLPGNTTEPMLIKALHFNRELTNTTRAFTFSVVNIPSNVTKSEVNIWFQGAKVDACDVISRTFDASGVEIGYDVRVRSDTQNYGFFRSKALWSYPDNPSNTYQLNFYCYVIENSFLSNFMKINAQIGGVRTPITYLEEYNRLGAFQLSFDERSGSQPTDGSRYYSANITIANLTQSLPRGMNITFGELIRNMKVFEMGSDTSCSVSSGQKGQYGVNTKSSTWGQLGNEISLSFALPMDIQAGDYLRISCPNLAWRTSENPKYFHNIWALTAGEPLGRVQAQKIVLQPF